MQWWQLSVDHSGVPMSGTTIFLVGAGWGFLVSLFASWVAWPIYVQLRRLPGEQHSEASARELARLDRLAELEEIPDTRRSE